MMFRKRAAGIERVSVLIIHLLFKVRLLIPKSPFSKQCPSQGADRLFIHIISISCS